MLLKSINPTSNYRVKGISGDSFHDRRPEWQCLVGVVFYPLATSLKAAKTGHIPTQVPQLNGHSPVKAEMGFLFPWLLSTVQMWIDLDRAGREERNDRCTKVVIYPPNHPPRGAAPA